MNKQHIPTDQQAIRYLIASAVLCLAIFLATIPLPRIDNHLVGSDGLRYYAITRSLALDRDLDFTNDYALLNVTSTVTVTGRLANPFAIGTALLWMPFFVLAHLLGIFLNSIGWYVPLDGVNYLYEASVCLGTIVYASLGFILTYYTLRRIPVENALWGFWAVIGMWWATPAIYYMIAEPSMSHGLTVFSIALFLFTWYKPKPDRSLWGWAKVGFSAGLVALTRWQDGIILLIPLIEIGYWAYHRKISLAQAMCSLLVLATTAFLTFLPQPLMWKTLYGEYFTVPQGNDFFNWANPQILPTLFSGRHGLFSWHPIFLITLFGLPFLWKRDRAITLVIIYMFIGELYINSAVLRWWADDAFGGRRFVSLIPLFALPLGALIAQIKRTWAILALIALIFWNGLCLAQYRLGFVAMNETLTLYEMTLGRLLIPFELAKRILRGASPLK